MEHVSRLCQSEGKKDYRVKKIKKQGTENKAVLFHFPNALRKWMSDGKTEFHPYEFEKYGAIEFLYSGYMETCLIPPTIHTEGGTSNLKQEFLKYEREFIKDLKQITEKLNE